MWNSENYSDYGIERAFRLFLVVAKIFFPGIYIDRLFRHSSFYTRKVAGEFYVLFKTLYPFVLLYFGLTDYTYLYVLNIYLLIETFVYIFHKIYISEYYQQRSHKRSLLLLFLNFLEVILSFAVIYTTGKYLNKPLYSWIDAVYFSFVTGATIGYGDYYPVGGTAKGIVILQGLGTLSFLILFFNFFAPRVQDEDEPPLQGNSE